MIKLIFTREFTTGNLKGIKHHDSINFLNVKSAKQWVEDVNRNNSRGSVEYKVINFEIMEL